MASELSSIIKAYGEAFDEERKAVAPTGTTAYLLVRTGQNDDSFRSLKQVTVHWLAVFSSFRAQMGLQIADEDTDIVTAITKCSDMSIDGYVYQVDRRDVMPPDSERPWWDLFGTKTGETFTPTP